MSADRASLNLCDDSILYRHTRIPFVRLRIPGTLDRFRTILIRREHSGGIAECDLLSAFHCLTERFLCAEILRRVRHDLTLSIVITPMSSSDNPHYRQSISIPCGIGYRLPIMLALSDCVMLRDVAECYLCIPRIAAAFFSARFLIVCNVRNDSPDSISEIGKVCRGVTVLPLLPLLPFRMTLPFRLLPLVISDYRSNDRTYRSDSLKFSPYGTE